MFLHRIGDCPIRSPLGALGAPYPNFGELTNQSFIFKKTPQLNPTVVYDMIYAMKYIHEYSMMINMIRDKSRFVLVEISHVHINAVNLMMNHPVNQL